MTPALFRGNSVAVILPCYNEAPVIASVVAAFRAALPGAAIHVFDNGSTDGTADVARAAGAEITYVSARGKGNVVRRMFADVEADIYLMADGDGTYDASAAPEMLGLLITHGLDMVVGCRVPSGAGNEYRFGHRFGNRMLTRTVARIFGEGFTDMLSGYRAFSRRYVKSFPALSKGFEIETELTIHALELRAPYGQVATAYGERAEGTKSKLTTWGDGFRIMKTILKLHMLERPRSFYLTLALGGCIASLVLAMPIIIEYLETGLVPRLPTALAAVAVMLGALLSAACAVILDSVVTGRSEAKRLVYLSIPATRPKALK
jgi:glycosyltransferase involved in cell wall biosynthesis